ncbi:hypothetical protein SCA6_019900 [Theobroma cacao]
MVTLALPSLPSKRKMLFLCTAELCTSCSLVIFYKKHVDMREKKQLELEKQDLFYTLALNADAREQGLDIIGCPSKFHDPLGAFGEQLLLENEVDIGGELPFHFVNFCYMT